MRDDEITIYHNDLNRTILRRWTSEEKNIFMALVTKLRDLGTKRVFLNSDEVKELIRFDKRVSGRYDKILENAIKKIVQISYVEKNDRKIRAMNLFSYLEVDLNEKTIEAQVSDQYTYVLNKLNSNFSSHLLETYIDLKSTYSKGIFQLLNEYSSLGKREFEIEEFRLLLDIPKSYNVGMITKQVIKPALIELSSSFEDLKYKPVKKNTRGTPVIGYIFTWKPQQSSTQKWINGKYNKKSKQNNYDLPPADSLAASDNRMTREEREKFVRKKMNIKLPIKKKETEKVGEIKNVEGQMDLKDL